VDDIYSKYGKAVSDLEDTLKKLQHYEAVLVAAARGEITLTEKEGKIHYERTSVETEGVVRSGSGEAQ